MVKTQTRKIIRIDEEKCTGCGLCVPSCAEGAIKIENGKARLVSEIYCDGLGACLGECPEDALTIEEREVVPFDEKATGEHLKKLGRDPSSAHQLSAQEETHPSVNSLGGGCPGSQMRALKSTGVKTAGEESGKITSRLRQWPIQLHLVPPFAPFFQGADLVIAADCTAFSYAEFHRDLLEGKQLVIACPKLDDLGYYQEKLTEMFKQNDLKSITVVHMEVPCCFGIVQATKMALEASGKKIPLHDIIISVEGNIL